MEQFLNEIAENFNLEDFTGNLGVLLDENADEEEIGGALSFIEKLYDMAVKNSESI